MFSPQKVEGKKEKKKKKEKQVHFIATSLFKQCSLAYGSDWK